ncbi:MAG: S41 family peptidase, partial [Chitinispirillaceae bacterium]
SAGSWAALQFSLMDNTILIGDTTYGAWGRLVEKQLPNGWTYGYSIARCYSPDMVFLEGRGVPPDIRTSSTHIENDRDPVLEAVMKDIVNR